MREHEHSHGHGLEAGHGHGSGHGHGGGHRGGADHVHSGGHGGHGHDHGHAHGLGAALFKNLSPQQALLGVLCITLAYMVAELIGGLVSGSLALLADAGHMVTDVGALALSLMAMWFAARPPTPQKSFGYYRLEILAALVNGATLVAIAAWIVMEAIGRLREPVHVDTPIMLAVAAGGLVVNLIGISALRESAQSSLNVRGALAHVIGDALGSVGTLVAGGIIWFTGWTYADPVASVAIAVLVLRSAWHLVTMSVDVLMLGCPVHLDPEDVLTTIRGDRGVKSAHDLHIWTVTSRMMALSCHAVVEEGADPQEVLGRLKRELACRFGIEHVTIQLERVSLEREERCVQGLEGRHAV